MRINNVTASEMKKRITIQQATISYDEIGGQIVSWQDLATIWAKIEPMHNSEIFTNNKISARERAKITIRYRDDVDNNSRLLVDNTIFQIISIINKDKQNHSLEILAEAM